MQNIIGIAMIVVLLVGGVVFYSCSGDSDESGEKTEKQMIKNETDSTNEKLNNR